MPNLITFEESFIKGPRHKRSNTHNKSAEASHDCEFPPLPLRDAPKALHAQEVANEYGLKMRFCRAGDNKLVCGFVSQKGIGIGDLEVVESITKEARAKMPMPDFLTDFFMRNLSEKMKAAGLSCYTAIKGKDLSSEDNGDCFLNDEKKLCLLNGSGVDSKDIGPEDIVRVYIGRTEACKDYRVMLGISDERFDVGSGRNGRSNGNVRFRLGAWCPN